MSQVFIQPVNIHTCAPNSQAKARAPRRVSALQRRVSAPRLFVTDQGSSGWGEVPLVLCGIQNEDYATIQPADAFQRVTPPRKAAAGKITCATWIDRHDSARDPVPEGHR